MSAIKSFIEALPDDDMKKKIEKWSKIGVNDINLQNLADVMFGWDKAVYNFDGTRATEWHGNEWVDANKRIPGFIDIISETAVALSQNLFPYSQFKESLTFPNSQFRIPKIAIDLYISSYGLYLLTKILIYIRHSVTTRLTYSL